MRTIAFLLNRYRAEIVPMLVLALVVAVSAFLAAAGPRLFNRVADDGLRYDVGRAQSLQRNIELGQIGHLSGGSALEPVADRGPELEAELPESVRSLIVDRTFHAESASWSVFEPPREQPTWLRFRFPVGVDERITYVDGRAPTGDTNVIPGRRGTAPGDPEDATVFEVALATQIADTLNVGVGDRLELFPDTEDALVGQFSSPVRAAVDVVGIYTVDDPDDEFWMNDSSLELPTVIVVSPDLQLLYGTALLSADAYPALVGNGLPARYSWRYFLDPDRFDAGTLDQLTADLRQMRTRYPPFVTTLRDAEVTTLQTGLVDLLDAYAAERRTAEAVLVTASLGPAAVATAAVALVALLMVHRRRRAVTLVRGRGASVGQLLGSHLLEGLLIAVPASAIAYLAAITLVEGRASTWSSVLTAIVAGGAALVLMLTVLRPATAPLREGEREVSSAARLSPRRLTFEALVIVLAGGGAFLLRQRGIAGGSTAGELAGVDPLLAAVPALIGLAVGLLTVRLYPLPLQAAGWFADGWRGIVPAFGLRRAARTGDVGSLPLIVLLVTVAIGAFSSTIFVTVERGQSAAAWQEVGADLAITPGTRPFPPDFDATTLTGVEAAARMHVDTAVLGGRGGARVQMNALDTPAFAAVTAGTEADPRLPPSMRAAPIPDEPIPAILSARVASGGSRPIRVNDEVEMLVSARTLTLQVVADSFELPRRGLRCRLAGGAARDGSGRGGRSSVCGQRDLPARPRGDGCLGPGGDGRGAAGHRRHRTEGGARGVAGRSAGAGRGSRLRARGGDRDRLRGAGDDGRACPPGSGEEPGDRAPAHLGDDAARPAGAVRRRARAGRDHRDGDRRGVGRGRRVVRGARARSGWAHRLVDRRRARRRLGGGRAAPAGAGRGAGGRDRALQLDRASGKPGGLDAAGHRMSLRG